MFRKLNTIFQPTFSRQCSALRTHVESLVLKALPGKLDIKRHSPSIQYISASLAMSTSVLKALPGKHVIKTSSILYISASLAMSTSVLKALPGKHVIKTSSILYISASLAMSTSVLKALPGKLDIKRHSPSILYIYVHHAISCCINNQNADK